MTPPAATMVPAQAPRGARAALRRRWPIYRRPLWVGFSALGVVLLVWLFVTASAVPGAKIGFDLYAYWNVNPFHAYDNPLGSLGSFTYSPAAALVFAPAHLIPFEAFYALWTALLAAILVGLCRRNTLVWLCFLPIPLELWHGNIHLVLAAVCVLGFRYPALWSVALLTKVTPGVGLLWFAVRREWRSLGIALGATAVVALVSFVVAPGAWGDWIRFLTDSGVNGPGQNDKEYLRFVPPLAIRVVGAAVLVTWGALTDRRWTVPVAATLALPVLWITGPAILAALPALRRVPAAPRAAAMTDGLAPKPLARTVGAAGDARPT